MSHIFISYSRKDRRYARKLAQKLRDEGFDVWIDDHLQSGEDWWDTIDKAISDCSAFIVIVSTSSRQSKWVKREVLLAENRNKPRYPLLLEGEEWSLIIDLQHEDVRHGDMPPQLFFDILGRYAPRMETYEDDIPDTAMPIQVAAGAGIRGGLPDIAWVDIPEGNFMYEHDEKTTQEYVPEFAIARYPITYLQYAIFIGAGGYKDSKYWTSEGWAWREDYNVDKPILWDDPSWNRHNHPVIGISWFEAIAFCSWLSQAIGNAEVSLPTDQQWMKAARGTTNYKYPWGNKCTSADANINDAYFNGYSVDPKQLRRAKPVHAFTKLSPYGVRDMAGNVWEWCLPAIPISEVKASTQCQLHGGSWYFNHHYAAIRFRLLAQASTKRYEAGFRVVKNFVE